MRFAEVDDGQGETAGLARASMRTALGDIAVGILDYGAPATYVLVPGAGAAQATLTDVVLKALAEEGAIARELSLTLRTVERYTVRSSASWASIRVAN